MTIRFKRNREIGKPLTVKFAIRTYDASVDCRNFPIDCRNYNLGDRLMMHVTKTHSQRCIIKEP